MTFDSPIVKRPCFVPGAMRENGRYNLTAEDRREIERDIRLDRIATHGDEMKAFVAKTKDFRQTWGKFTAEGWEFDRVVRDGPYITQYMIDKIRGWMSETTSRAQARLQIAHETPYIPVDGDSELSDAEVAAGVRWLRAGGWSSYDVSLGHGCNAMLDIDYPGAIAVARGIIGKYSKTLRKAGVIE